MRKTSYFALIPIGLLAGCAIVPAESDRSETGHVPDEVFGLAAPDQDLSTVRLLPEDGCYWYMHSGPVETTLVPLRAVGGRPICNAQQA